jgi:hypothetical protein
MRRWVPHTSFFDRACAELDSLAAAKRAELAQLESNRRTTATEGKNSIGSLKGGEREKDAAGTRGPANSKAHRCKSCGASCGKP